MTDSGSAGSGTVDSGSGDSGSGSGSAGSADLDSGSGSESGDTGEPLPECPEPDEGVAAGFSVEVDGTPIVLEYGDSQEVSGLPEEWAYQDALPEIDGMCDVVEAVPGSLTVTCIDTLDTERTLTVHLAASEALSTDGGGGPVHVHYQVNLASDMLEHVSDSIAHAFVVSNDAGIVLMGIDGRYSIDASLSEAWPQWPDVSIGHGECSGPEDEVTFELEDGSTGVFPHGSAGDLGGYRVLVERADNTTEFDGEFDQTTQTARWLLGLPG